MCARNPIDATRLISGFNFLENNMDLNEEWLKRENKLLKSRRKYIHFDIKISPHNSITNISNPTFIKTRAFWPFIESGIVFSRYKKDKESGSRHIEPKERKICYASHLDSQIYSYYNFLLTQKYEQRLTENALLDSVIAYRSIDKKCNIHFAYDIFESIKNYQEIVALTFDIENFFDTLDHQLLLKQWKSILAFEYLPIDHYKVFKSLTKFSSVKLEDLNKIFNLDQKLKINYRKICSSFEFREKVRNTGLIVTNSSNKGIPQGSPLSGLLSNIYMLDFDILMNSKVNDLNGLYRRYSDDLLFLIPPSNKDEMKQFVLEAITSLCKLEINLSKTDVTMFNKLADNSIIATNELNKPSLLQYLGFNFDGKNILIRSSSISRFYRNMKKRINRSVWQTKNSKFNKSKVFKRKLYRLYSHLGKRNFISYAFRASNIQNSDKIKKQVSKHWNFINQKLKNIDRN